MKQQATRPLLWVIKPVTGRLPWLDVAAVEEDLVIFNAGKFGSKPKIIAAPCKTLTA